MSPGQLGTQASVIPRHLSYPGICLPGHLHPDNLAPGQTAPGSGSVHQDTFIDNFFLAMVDTKHFLVETAAEETGEDDNYMTNKENWGEFGYNYDDYRPPQPPPGGFFNEESSGFGKPREGGKK